MLYCWRVLELRAGRRRPPSSSRTRSRPARGRAEPEQDREQPQLADRGFGGRPSATRRQRRRGRPERDRRGRPRGLGAGCGSSSLMRSGGRLRAPTDRPWRRCATRSKTVRRPDGTGGVPRRRRESSIGPDGSRASLRRPRTRAAWLARNAVDCLPEGALERKLALGRPLRVKLGIDPTAPDIHLGFTVVLQKLREFQDLGHTVVLIIGDYTARVGDPERPLDHAPGADPTRDRRQRARPSRSRR